MTKNEARWDQLLGAAEALLPRFLAATGSLTHEKKGIRRSELFFFYTLVAPRAPARIVESGRARAQSTLVLSLLFPETAIVSLESDPHSPDVAIAAEKLADRANVDCRFGDSLILLPELVGPGDVVLIDGPKDFRALKLALRLLRSRGPAAVFVHDLWLGSPARRFVDHQLSSALLSDDARWVERYASLDSSKPAPSADSSGRRAYGATLSSFEKEATDYGRGLQWRCAAAQGADRLRETARRIFHHPPVVRPKDFARLD